MKIKTKQTGTQRSLFRINTGEKGQACALDMENVPPYLTRVFLMRKVSISIFPHGSFLSNLPCIFNDQQMIIQDRRGHDKERRVAMRISAFHNPFPEPLIVWVHLELYSFAFTTRPPQPFGSLSCPSFLSSQGLLLGCTYTYSTHHSLAHQGNAMH